MKRIPFPTRGAILLGLAVTALWSQTLTVPAGPIIFRQAATGPIANPQSLTVSATGANPVKWTAAVSGDTPWISLSATTGTTPATVAVSLVAWRAEAQAPGVYNGTVTFTAPGSAAAAVKVSWIVAARLPGPTFSYPAGPQNCTKPAGYPDPALCTVPDEKPPGTFAPPDVGGSYTDANFGGTVRVLTGPSVYHTYSDNNPLSAKNKYLMAFLSDGSFSVVDVASAQVVFPHVKANQDFVWDSYDDSIYYYPSGTSFLKHDLTAGTDTVVVDYSKDGHNFTKTQRGGTTQTSKDNWVSFFAANEHQVCTLDLNTATTYCADYSKAAGVPFGAIDYVLDAKGVDKTTGKRYMIVVTSAASAPAVYSVNLTAHRLDLEYRGPEDPESKGNHDGVCDPGEKCMLPTHSDTMEDASGTQFLVYDAFTNSPCEVAVGTYQLNKGANIVWPVEIGGGKRRVMSLWQCPFPNNNGGTDDHVGCAKNAPMCVISTVSPYQHPTDADVRFPHATEVLVMRGNGTEIRRLAESRSVRFYEDGDSAYWADPRAAISNDGSLVVFDSNFGNVGGVRVNIVSTGFSKPSISVLNAADMTPGLAPGSFATLQGGNLTDCTATGTVAPMTTNLCGATVTFNSVPAMLAYASPSQVNALVPRTLLSGNDVTVSVSAGAATAATGTGAGTGALSEFVPAGIFTDAAPGIFSYDLGDGVDRAVMQNALGVLNGPVQAAGNTVPAVLGEAQVLWANGLGPTSPMVADGEASPSDTPALTANAVSVYVNGVPQTVQFCGLAPGLTGNYQVNFLLDPSTPVLPEGQNFVWVEVEGQPSLEMAISIAPADSVAGTPLQFPPQEIGRRPVPGQPTAV